MSDKKTKKSPIKLLPKVPTLAETVAENPVHQSNVKVETLKEKVLVDDVSKNQQKLKNNTFLLNEEIHKLLELVAEKRKTNVSDLISSLVKQHLSSDEVDTVVLKIPKTLRNNKLELTNWLNARFNSIVATLAP